MVISILWCVYNYLMVYEIQKMTCASIKYDVNGKMKYGQGKVYQKGHVDAWLGKHQLLMGVTRMFSHIFGTRGKVEHPHHRLFGAAADQGPDMLLHSVKYLAFVLVTIWTVLGLVVVIPDFMDLVKDGYDPVVMRELIFFSICNTPSAAAPITSALPCRLICPHIRAPSALRSPPPIPPPRPLWPGPR